MSDTPSIVNDPSETPEAASQEGSQASSRENASQPSSTTLCPYCGTVNATDDKCGACGGLFEPLSLRATQIAMGPWQLRDKHQPFRPGFSYETLKKMVASGRVKANTVLRGPTTMQFWQVARNTPGVSHLLGVCHACNGPLAPEEVGCPKCGAQIVVPIERDRLGLQYPTEDAARAAQKRLAAEIAMINGEVSAGDGIPESSNQDAAQAGSAQPPVEQPAAPMTEDDLLAGLFSLDPSAVPADGQDWPDPFNTPAPAPGSVPASGTVVAGGVPAHEAFLGATSAPGTAQDNPFAGTALESDWNPSAPHAPMPQPMPSAVPAASGGGGMVKILIAVNVVLVVIAAFLIWLMTR